MKLFNILLGVLVLFFILPSVSVAGDFDWMKDFSIKAEADQSGFKARLAARFKIGNAEINAAIGTTDNPADAYMVLRLGEMSGKPAEEVIKKYKSGKSKGWGSLAKSLGIKPGSKEFKSLKNGDDLYQKGSKTKDKGKGKKKK